MHKRHIAVVVTDLDNTLYDWVEMWYQSFSAMLAKILEEIEPKGIRRGRLISEIRTVHQTHGTSEYAFLLEELPCLREILPGKDIVQNFDEAIHSYRKARKEHLRLYPGVMQTLQTLKDAGVLVVAYTESMAFYTNYRLRHLQLDGLIDYLYSPADHDLPSGMTEDEIRRYPPEHYHLRYTEHRHTPKGELKPNPKILKSILDDIGVDGQVSIYIGDSLMKDIAMAKDAEVIDVYAEYGKAQHRAEYELLREVSHWTDEDVAREKQLQHRHVNPTHVLESSFSEILGLFNFQKYEKKTATVSYLAERIEIWKKAIDVQQHFNDLEMRIRNFAITILGALFGAAGLALSRDVTIEIGDRALPLGLFLLVAALLTWSGFWFMDRHWYHKLLYGSVEHGMKVENSIKSIIPEITLTDSIGKASPMFIGRLKIRSPRKIDIFYGIGAAAIVVAIVALVLAAGVSAKAVPCAGADCDGQPPSPVASRDGRSMGPETRTAGIAGQGSTPHSPILAKWAQLAPPEDGCDDVEACEPSILVRAIVPEDSDCTGLAYSFGERTPIAMQPRHNPNPSAFPVVLCEKLFQPSDLGVSFKDGTHLTWSARLSSEGDGPKRVAIIGDTGCRIEKGQDCSTVRTWPLAKVVADAAYLDGEPPDLVVHVGDVRYRGTDRWEDWYADFFRPARVLLEAAPWIVARGNHDNCVKDKGAGWMYFFQPKLQRVSECADQPDTDPIDLWPQAFDVAQDLRLVVLDSANSYYRCDRWADRFELYKPRLEKLLQPARADAMVWLVTHYPVWHVEERGEDYCAGGKSSLKPMRGLLESTLFTQTNRVSAILSGDIHHFEVVLPRGKLETGPLQFVAGNGGVLISPELGKNPQDSCTSGTIHFMKDFAPGGRELTKGTQHQVDGVAVCEHGMLLAERISNTWRFSMRPARLDRPDARVSCTLDEPRNCVGPADQANRKSLDGGG
jgi:phosphoglycolate phosphatase-like HAD superfamily hydrolase